MAATSTRTANGVVQGTVVFTDLVGFTEFNALRGDEEALELLATQERLVLEMLPPEGRIVKELGDGLLLWFPDACEALQTAIRLQERFEQVGSRLPGVEFEELGPVVMKGIPDPVRLFRAMAEDA
jgi:class 3 adenylate cyclase